MTNMSLFENATVKKKCPICSKGNVPMNMEIGEQTTCNNDDCKTNFVKTGETSLRWINPNAK